MRGKGVKNTPLPLLGGALPLRLKNRRRLETLPGEGFRGATPIAPPSLPTSRKLPKKGKGLEILIDLILIGVIGVIGVSQLKTRADRTFAGFNIYPYRPPITPKAI